MHNINSNKKENYKNKSKGKTKICKQKAPFLFVWTVLTCCLRMYLFLTSFPQISQGTLLSLSAKTKIFQLSGYWMLFICTICNHHCTLLLFVNKLYMLLQNVLVLNQFSTNLTRDVILLSRAKTNQKHFFLTW